MAIAIIWARHDLIWAWHAVPLHQRSYLRGHTGALCCARDRVYKGLAVISYCIPTVGARHAVPK